MYSIFDVQVGCFLNPLTFTNHAEAVRWFQTIVNDRTASSGPVSNISLYPEQFELWFVGIWDDGKATWEQQNDQMVRGNEVRDALPAITVDDLLERLEERLTALKVDNVSKVRMQ